jgi:predicted acetyltransferase
MSIELPDGFEFRVLRTDDEFEELLQFNSIIHEEGDAKTLRRLIENLPGFGREHNYFVRDLDKGVIVSAANEIPSIWDYDGVALRNLELGFVGTLEEYRNHGFIRALYSYFEKRFFEGEYDISTIQGIPYYYRQFGYDFVLPLDQSAVLRADQILRVNEETPPEYMSLTVRDTVPNDIDSLAALYDKMAQRLLVTVRRSRNLWDVQERIKKRYQDAFRTLVIENEETIEGYLRVTSYKEQGYINVFESSIITISAVNRTLQFLRKHALELGVSTITLPGTVESNLSRVGLDLGGHINRGWKNMVRIPDMVRFLNKIRPVLEKRLHGTMFEGITRELFINVFRNCPALRFENGSLLEVEDVGMPLTSDKLEFRTPPNDFVRLILGDYDIAELENNNIDFIVRGPVRSLVSTLFPKCDSQIFYYHC